MTEYGVADLRGKSDAQVIAAMLEITDSRFQPELMQQAKKAGKLASDHVIPERACRNTPDALEQKLSAAKAKGDLPPFPFGSDFNEVEQRLIPALGEMRAAAASPLAVIGLAMAGRGRGSSTEEEAVARMKLDAPATMHQRLYAAMLRGALRKTTTT